MLKIYLEGCGKSYKRNKGKAGHHNSSIRIPSGNELGAWPEYWEPGGYTSGGIKEAVVDPVKEGGYIYEHLFK